MSLSQISVNKRDIFISILLTLAVLANPFFLRQEINLFELGLYLPGIDGIVHGQVPFRDFFYLRGPFELYVPALMMKAFGEHLAVLSVYFYAGTVVLFLAVILIARELINSRFLFYALITVEVARTFPRVVYTYWGGMRFAWGMLAILCAVRFLKTRKISWIAAAGVLSAIGALTSIEIGVASAAAVCGALILEVWAGEKSFREQISVGAFFFASAAAVVLPYFFYLHLHGALIAYFDTLHHVTTQMTKTFLQSEPVPSSLGQVLAAMFNPRHVNFKQMTPLYCLMAFAVYLVFKARRRQLTPVDAAASAVMFYAFVVYATGFRNLWANVFEMALQPEKIVLFFLFERILSYLEIGPWMKKIVDVLIVAIVISSVVFAFGHFQKRFFAVQWAVKTVTGKNTKKVIPLAGQEVEKLDLERVKWMTVPKWQAEDLKELDHFFKTHTTPGEAVFMYPELGALHFILNRPSVGKFPTATLSWINDNWHKELMRRLRENLPRYAVVNAKTPDYFEKTYFLVEANRRYWQEAMSIITIHYRPVAQTPTYIIYERR